MTSPPAAKASGSNHSCNSRSGSAATRPASASKRPASASKRPASAAKTAGQCLLCEYTSSLALAQFQCLFICIETYLKLYIYGPRSTKSGKGNTHRKP